MASLKKYSDDTLVHENEIISKAKAIIKELKAYTHDIVIKHNEKRDVANKSNEYWAQVIAKYYMLMKAFAEKENLILRQEQIIQKLKIETLHNKELVNAMESQPLQLKE